MVSSVLILSSIVVLLFLRFISERILIVFDYLGGALCSILHFFDGLASVWRLNHNHQDLSSHGISQCRVIQAGNAPDLINDFIELTHFEVYEEIGKDVDWINDQRIEPFEVLLGPIVCEIFNRGHVSVHRGETVRKGDCFTRYVLPAVVIALKASVLHALCEAEPKRGRIRSINDKTVGDGHAD